MCPDGRKSGIPTGGIGGGRHLSPEIGAIEFELHADHADVIRGRGRDGDRAGDRGASSRRRDRHRRRDVVDGDVDRGRGGRVTRRVAGHRSQGVRANGGACGVPRKGVRGSQHFSPEVRPIQFELHASHAHVVGGRSRDRDGSPHVRPISRRRHRDCGRRRVVTHGDGSAARRGGVARGVAGHGGEGVGPIAGCGRVPRESVGRRGHLRPQSRPIQLELHAGHAAVIRSRGRHRDGGGDRGASGRRGHGNGRRRRVRRRGREGVQGRDVCRA